MALDSVSISVNKGDIYGLIGKNGAGKTTFMRIISSLINKDDGEVYLFSNDNYKKEIHRVGFVIERPFLYLNNTAMENINLYCKLSGVSEERIAQVLEIVGLNGVDNKKKVGNFSFGMKQRLNIASALVALPELLVLDEPLNGLDPLGVHDLRELLIKLNLEHGITIFVSSHILEELTKISNRYGILDKGRLIGEYSNDEIIGLERHVKFIVSNSHLAVKILNDDFGLSNTKVTSKTEFKFFGETDLLPKINSTLINAGIDLKNVTTVENNLEGYFLRLIGAEVDEE